MTAQQVNYFLSTPRFQVYLTKTGNDFDKAIQLYKSNIELSESFYPILSVLEISLRNAINQKLTEHFNDPFWFKNSLPIDFLPFVSEATQKLIRQRKTITADKIVAELNFGFWNRLFSRNYTAILWKPLRVIFQNTPKKQRQRDTIADSLYRIRTLRNRIYHYEPIFGNLQEIDEIHTEMLTFLNWLDKDLPNLISDINRFEEILNKAKNI
jgi:hypothetical protein